MDAAPVKAIGVSHDAAARLVGLTPAQLERLVDNGHVRRNDKNSYSVPVLVGDYAEHLRSEDLKHPSQIEMAGHVDLSDRSVRELEAKLKLPNDYTRAAFRVAYIRHLREVAAGRTSSTEEALDLAAERAALAKAQREGVEIKNSVLRGDYASVTLLAEVLANASQSVAERFDHLPGLLRKTLPDLPQAAVDQVMVVIAAARNEWTRATVELVRTTLTTPEDDEPQLDLDDEPRAD